LAESKGESISGSASVVKEDVGIADAEIDRGSVEEGMMEPSVEDALVALVRFACDGMLDFVRSLDSIEEGKVKVEVEVEVRTLVFVVVAVVTAVFAVDSKAEFGGREVVELFRLVEGVRPLFRHC